MVLGEEIFLYGVIFTVVDLLDYIRLKLEICVFIQCDISNIADGIRHLHNIEQKSGRIIISAL